jgi:Ca-activated chloride channel family protein
MSFAGPLLLLSLLLVPVAVVGWRVAERRRMRYAVRYTNVGVLAAVVGGRADWRRYLPLGLFLFALAALCVAMARPRVPRLSALDRATVILVIDASGSMQSTDVFPTRLAAAEGAVRGFLDLVPERFRVGLVVFAGEPLVAAVPTTDRALVKASLSEVANFPGLGGTAIGDALAEAVRLGKRSLRALPSAVAAPSSASRNLVSIVFLSDGSQNRGALQPLQGAERAKRAGVPVYTVALGTPNGTLTRNFDGVTQTIPVPPDPDTLRAIASLTGGKFFAATTDVKVKDAYSKLGHSLGRTTVHREITYAFLAAAAALLISAGALSTRWSPRLP